MTTDQVVLVESPWGWNVALKHSQALAGYGAAIIPGATHHTIWTVLKDAGVAVRGGLGEYPASQAASAIAANVNQVGAILLMEAAK